MLRHGRQLRFAYRLLGLGYRLGRNRARPGVCHLYPCCLLTTIGSRCGPVFCQASGARLQNLPMEVRPAPWARPEALLLYALAGLSLIFLAIWRLLVGLDRKASAQREIAASRERLRLALWGSRDELWEADLDKQILVRENRMDRLENRDHMARMTLAEFWASIHPDDLPALKQTFVDHVRGTTDHFEAEFRGRMDDGPWRWMLVTRPGHRSRRTGPGKTPVRNNARYQPVEKKPKRRCASSMKNWKAGLASAPPKLQQSNRTLQQSP